MKTLKKLLALTIVGIASFFGSSAKAASKGDVSKRVNTVRKEIKKRIESGNDKDIPRSFFLGSNMKDWINWSNWGNWNNWSNWSNWDNWSKWSKWDNWVNWANRWGNTK